MRRFVPPAAAAILLAALAVSADVVVLRSLELLPLPWPPVYAPEPVPMPERVERRPAPARAVWIVMLDGLRLDVSRDLPHLSRLRGQGADVVARCLFPTFTRVGYATMLSGRGPLGHGYMSNFNIRPAVVPSAIDMARTAGVPTRLLFHGVGGVPGVFAQGFPFLAEVGSTEHEAWTGREHLTFVYVREPDKTGHRHGGGSEAYREAARSADAALGRILAEVDLAREAIIVTTDHGHIDRGGHGGHEPIVEQIPLVLAGAGVRKGVRLGADYGADLRDVAVTACALLGVPAPPRATGQVLEAALTGSARTSAEPKALRPPRPSELQVSALLRGLLGGLLLGGLAVALLGLPAVRATGGALVAAVAFALIYRLRDYPASFSCLNTESEIPGFILELAMWATLTSGLGIWVARGARAYAPAGLGIFGAWVGISAGWVGLGAPTAFDFPRVTFLVHLAATLCAGAAAAVVIGSWVGGGGGARGPRKS